LYYTFKGSEELTRWFVDELTKNLGLEVARAVSTHEDPRSQLRAGIAATTALASEQPALTLALLRGVFTGEDMTDRIKVVRETVFPAVRAVLERGIDDGSFVAVDVDETIAAFIGVIALLSLHRLGQLGPLQPRPGVNDIVSIMLNGLSAGRERAGEAPEAAGAF